MVGKQFGGATIRLGNNTLGKQKEGQPYGVATV